MNRIDKNNIEAVNGRDEADVSSPDYALSVIIDKINEIIDWINAQ
tara:strand:- start:364 stop:498 length:135 start_codon:yes stop_codon:yes gene_type:complete